MVIMASESRADKPLPIQRINPNEALFALSMSEDIGLSPEQITTLKNELFNIFTTGQRKTSGEIRATEEPDLNRTIKARAGSCLRGRQAINTAIEYFLVRGDEQLLKFQQRPHALVTVNKLLILENFDFSKAYWLDKYLFFEESQLVKQLNALIGASRFPSIWDVERRDFFPSANLTLTIRKIFGQGMHKEMLNLVYKFQGYYPRLCDYSKDIPKAPFKFIPFLMRIRHMDETQYIDFIANLGKKSPELLHLIESDFLHDEYVWGDGSSWEIKPND